MEQIAFANPMKSSSPLSAVLLVLLLSVWSAFLLVSCISSETRSGQTELSSDKTEVFLENQEDPPLSSHAPPAAVLWILLSINRSCQHLFLVRAPQLPHISSTPIRPLHTRQALQPILLKIVFLLPPKQQMAS